MINPAKFARQKMSGKVKTVISYTIKTCSECGNTLTPAGVSGSYRHSKSNCVYSKMLVKINHRGVTVADLNQALTQGPLYHVRRPVTKGMVMRRSPIRLAGSDWTYIDWKGMIFNNPNQK